MGLLNLPKQVFYGSLILHQRRSIELYLFFSARFIAMGRWEKRCVRKFLAVRFRQAPIEDGLDIALVQINRVKTLVFIIGFLLRKPITRSPCRAFSGAKCLLFSLSYNTGLPFARPAAGIFPVSSNRRSLVHHYLS